MGLMDKGWLILEKEEKEKGRERGGRAGAPRYTGPTPALSRERQRTATGKSGESKERLNHLMSISMIKSRAKPCDH